MTKFLNISVDSTLGGVNANDYTVSSQKAIKDYVDNKLIDIDNETIIRNSNNEIQVEGIVEQNNSDILSTWVGTKEEYEVLETKDINRVYIITNDDSSSSESQSCLLPIFYRVVTNHKLNDVSWLRSNPFSWQYASIYKAAYQHLINDFDITNFKSETIEGIDITYYLSKDNHRICLPDQENNLSSLYAKIGQADFYILDVENLRFKLPRIQKRKLIRVVKNEDGSWYNLYSDGWVEQGGLVGSNIGTSGVLNLPVPMANTNYTTISSINNNAANGAFILDFANRTTTTINWYKSNTVLIGNWEINGYADSLVFANESIQYEYYYVGNFEQSSIEQTAGINTEMFNQKVDIGHQVIEFQAPTEANNYTWYRKYADGWVEQGGVNTSSTASFSVLLPITMANVNYTALFQPQAGRMINVSSKSINQVDAWFADNIKGTYNWEVKGMAA